MRRLKNIMTVVAFLLHLGMPVHAAHADEETEIPLSEVPDAVLAAVRNARADIRIHSAVRLTDESGTLYEIEGDVGDSEVEFIVSPDGRVVETDKE